MGKDQPQNLWTADPRTILRAGPDFDLAAFGRGGKPGWDGGKSEGKALMKSRGALLSELQERLFAEGRAGGKRSVLCVVQGLDTAGKGGVVRHVMSMVDPQGVALRSFGVPTEEERSHHFLWRIRESLPTPGLIGVFDRSHYEDVLIVRVDDLVGEDVWSKRYDEINMFEEGVANDGITVLKFALMVSHQEQGIRLMERLDRPDKRWKYATSDIDTRSKWEAYQDAYSDVFARTSTDHAPWFVLPADRKWYSRLAITEILTQTLVEMDPGWPKPRWRVETQRRRLAASMGSEALAESLADTEDVVTEAVDESEAVQQRAISLQYVNEDSAQAQAEEDAELARLEARRAELMADLAATLADKKDLLQVRRAEEQAAAEKQEADELAVLAAELSAPVPEGADPLLVGVHDHEVPLQVGERERHALDTEGVEPKQSKRSKKSKKDKRSRTDKAEKSKGS